MTNETYLSNKFKQIGYDYSKLESNYFQSDIMEIFEIINDSNYSINSKLNDINSEDIYLLKTKKTGDITDYDIKRENENKIKKEIFSIEKIAKEDKTKIIFINRGRIKKKDKPKIKKGKNYHSKSKEDNMLHKIKVFFIKSSMNFINKRYKKYQTNQGKTKIKHFCKIKSKFVSTIKKEANLEFLNTFIKDLFSSDLSKIYNKLNNNYNKKLIEEIYKENKAKEVIEILDKTVEQLIQNYVNGDYKTEGFYIENELIHDKEKNPDDENNEEYQKKFIERAKDFKNIFENKTARRKKGTKITK